MANPNSPRGKANVVARQAEALRLYRDGHSYDEIAQELGYSNRSGAHHAVKAALDDRRRDRQELADNILDTQILRYTDGYRRCIDELDNAATEGREVGKAQLLTAARGFLDSLTKVYGLEQLQVSVTNRNALDDDLSDMLTALRDKLEANSDTEGTEGG